MAQKARALFALLMLNQGRDVPRDDLFKQMWPGLPRAHALDNFYTVWGNCISIVGEAPHLERNGEYCRIDPRFVRSDVASSSSSRGICWPPITMRGTCSTPMPRSRFSTAGASCRAREERAAPSTRSVTATAPSTSMPWSPRRVRPLQAHDMRVALWFARKAMEEDQTREDVYRALMKAQIASGTAVPGNQDLPLVS